MRAAQLPIDQDAPRAQPARVGAYAVSILEQRPTQGACAACNRRATGCLRDKCRKDLKNGQIWAHAPNLGSP
jgi:hypothetical protein